MKQTLPTTVLVIDDDRPVLRRFTRESLLGTNLGVLAADTLSSAVDIVDRGYPIGAVLADINFRPETQDEARNLADGLDFLEYVRKARPTVPLYVMSMDAEDRTMKVRAEHRGLPVRAWYDKLRPPSQLAPWVSIERDLILQALKAEPGFREEASRKGEDPVALLTDEHVAEKVRSVFNYPRLTYLQFLPKGSTYMIKEAIPVHCWPEGGEFRAKAVNIPLIVEVGGENAADAIDNLGEALVDEKAALDQEEESRITGYARFVKEQLEKFITRK